MRRGLLVVLGFLAVTLPATWLWIEWAQQAYGAVFGPAAKAVYGFLGLEQVPVFAQRLRYINLVPFLGLMLVTPGLALPRRIGGLGIGLLLLFASHMVLNALGAWLPAGERRLPAGAAVVSDALPFVIWVVIARQPLRRFVERSLDA